MAQRSTTWTMLLATAVLAAGVLRMWWSARPGSEEFPSSVHTLASNTLGAFWDWRTPTEKTPTEQLRFWTAEVERILDQHPQDAELHAAAALIFHEPARLSVSQLAQQISRNRSIPSDRWSAAIFDQWKRARHQFDLAGGVLVGKLAEKATELEPDNPSWWRLRAVLMEPPMFANATDRARPIDWRTVLDEAREHDPGNALYDLLEVNWSEEASIDFDDHANFIVGDANAWDESLQRTRSLVGQRHLTLGEPAIRGLVRLHELSAHPRPLTTESIRTRFVATIPANIAAWHARQLTRMSMVVGEIPPTASRHEIEDLAIEFNQFVLERGDPAVQYSNLLNRTHELALQTKRDRQQQDGEVDPGTAEQLAKARDRNSAITTASKLLDDRKNSATSTETALVSATLLALQLPSLTIAVATLVAWIILPRMRSVPQMRWWPFASFGLAWLLSFFFFGIGPAGAVSQTSVHWVFTGVTFVAVASLLTGALRRTSLRYRYGVRTLLMISTIAAITIGILFHFRVGWQQIGLPIAVSATPDPLLAEAATGNPIGLNLGPLNDWSWGPQWIGSSLLHWSTLDGQWWCLGINVAIMLIGLLWIRYPRDLLGGLMVSSILTCALLLAGWIWLEPTNYRSSRPTQLLHETYIRSIDQYYAPIAEDVERELAGGATASPEQI